MEFIGWWEVEWGVRMWKLERRSRGGRIRCFGRGDEKGEMRGKRFYRLDIGRGD